RAVRAAAPPARAIPRCCSSLPSPGCFLPDDSPEDPVHEPRRVLCRIALRERNRFVDRDLVRNLVAVELVDRDAEDVPLDRAESLGRPSFGRVSDAAVELRRVCRDLLGSRPRPLVDVPLVEGGERLARHVPLIEEEERRPPSGLAAHSISSTSTSTVSTITPHIVVSASVTCS